MLRRELAISFLVFCFILASVPTALCISSPPIIYVSGDSSGDFICQGKSDQVQINQALQFVAKNPGYTTVHLKGPFTYVIDDTLLIGSNTTLEGDSTAVIKLADHAGWPTMKPLIQQMNNMGNDNITVRGFEVNENYAGNNEIALGRGYYNIMYFIHSNNVKVYNMYMHDGTGDGLRINQGKNVQFYNNKIDKLGHVGLYAIRCENVEAWNNRITVRTDSGLRAWDSNHVKFHDNLIDSFYNWSAGGPGIQIEKSNGVVNNVEIYNNSINNTYGPGIWVIGYGGSYPRDEAQNVHIHNNIFYNTGTNPSIDWVGGVETSGFYDTLIENNVFDGVYHAAITNIYPPVSAGVNPGVDLSPKGTGYTTIVRSNLIINTQRRTKDPNGTGYAMINYYPETHIFIPDNNCLYNNIGGDYKNCASTTDIYMTPLIADPKNRDYHLQSTAGRWDGKTWVKDNVSSPCIDAGYRYSNYSNEPEPNGKRINVGPDGNTKYASKSENVSTPILPTANFSSNKNSGYVPLTVQFADLSQNTTSRTWNFGDGTNSTQENPMHTYSIAGNYTVTYTVSNANGTDSKIATITALQPVIPMANFNTNVTDGTVPLSVKFSDLSKNANGWRWNFGDGTNSNQTNPLHTYSRAGNYTVNLTVSNGNSKDSKLFTINVQKSIPTIIWSNPADITYGTALDNTQLNASTSTSGTFVYNPVAGTLLSAGAHILDVEFTPIDTANYTGTSKNVTIKVLRATPTITWSEPATIIYGTPLASTQLNARASILGTFVYTPSTGTVLNPGTQTLHVDFIPTDTANYSGASKDVITTVSEKPILPAANFSTNVSIGTVPLPVQFNDLSKNVTGWNWNFGDRTNSTQQNPMHTYSVAGNYTVTLTVGNLNGTDSMTRNISAVKKEKISNLSGTYNNRLREASPESIFTNSAFLDVGGMSDVGRYRDVLWFDLSEYTGDTQIKNATLSLFWYYPKSSRLKDTVIEIYRPASAWNTSYVSWNKKNKGIPWNNSGGDWYDSSGGLQGVMPYTSLTLRAGDFPSNSYCEFNVTNIVKDYVSGKYSNTGFLIKARNESDNYVAFYSAQCGNTSEVPELKLVYS